jgi:DNA-binding NtrC family response regulator
VKRRRNLASPFPFGFRFSMPDNSHFGLVVVVEDPSVCRLVKTVLKRHGHEVVSAEVWRAAEWIEHGDRPVELLITNRPQIFEGLNRAVPILYLASDPDWDYVSSHGSLSVLEKPFHPNELVEAVERMASMAGTRVRNAAG